MAAALVAGPVGCASWGRQNESTFRLYEEVNPHGEISQVRTVEMPSLMQPVLVKPYAVLTERELVGVRVVQTSEGLALYLKFDPHGSLVLDETTTRMRGQRLVAFADNRPIASWVVEKRISQGEILIRPELSDNEIMVLAENLRRAANRYQSLYLRQ
jgi:preprotein translocase subunit SecD